MNEKGPKKNPHLRIEHFSDNFNKVPKEESSNQEISLTEEEAKEQIRRLEKALETEKDPQKIDFIIATLTLLKEEFPDA